MSRRKMAREQSVPAVYATVAVDEEEDSSCAGNSIASATAAVAVPTATAILEHTATAIGVEIPLSGEETSAHMAYRARMQQYIAQSSYEPGVHSANSLIEDDDWGGQIFSEFASFANGSGRSSTLPRNAHQVRAVLYFFLLLLVFAFVASIYLFVIADDAEALQNMDAWAVARFGLVVSKFQSLVQHL